MQLPIKNNQKNLQFRKNWEAVNTTPQFSIPFNFPQPPVRHFLHRPAR
jgi:hypothetical protein